MQNRFLPILFLTMTLGTSVAGAVTATCTARFENSVANNAGHEWSYVQDGKEVAKDIFDASTSQNILIGNIPDGCVFTYAQRDSKKVMEELYFLKNKLNGKYLRYTPQGKVIETGFYEDGHHEGAWIKYFPNGQVSQQATYNAGLLVSQQQFYESGKIKTDVEFDRHGLKVGSEKHYSEDGILQAEFSYRNDKLHGPYSIYYADGKIQEEGLYSDGEPAGITKLYESNGMLHFKDFYNNGKKIKRKSYNPDGTLEYEQRYLGD